MESKKNAVLLRDFLIVVKILLSSVCVRERKCVCVFFLIVNFVTNSNVFFTKGFVFKNITDDFLMRQCHSCQKNHTKVTNANEKNFIEHF